MNSLFANGLRRASLEGLAAEVGLVGNLWLAEDVALTDLVIAAEMSGRGGWAKAAVNAARINVKTSGDVLEKAIVRAGHGVCGVGRMRGLSRRPRNA